MYSIHGLFSSVCWEVHKILGVILYKNPEKLLYSLVSASFLVFFFFLSFAFLPLPFWGLLLQTYFPLNKHTFSPDSIVCIFGKRKKLISSSNILETLRALLWIHPLYPSISPWWSFLIFCVITFLCKAKLHANSPLIIFLDGILQFSRTCELPDCIHSWVMEKALTHCAGAHSSSEMEWVKQVSCAGH